MSRFLRPCLAGILLAFLPALLVPAAAQGLRVEVFNVKRALTGRLWGSGYWIGFCVQEEDKAHETERMMLQLFNTRTLNIHSTGIAIDVSLSDDEQDWPLAVSGDQIAVQVSEADNGNRDFNGNGRTDDNVLELYNPAARQLTNLGVIGSRPTFHGGKLYFVQQESDARADLNGDGDQSDAVLCSYDLAEKKIESLGMEVGENGFQVVGDWIAVPVDEAAQGSKDLNDDKDIQDTVAQLYQISQKKWTNTHLECTFGMALTTKLLAVGVDEGKAGAKDLNGDGDAKDTVCEVWDLATGKVTNTAMDCSGDVVADGSTVGFATSESAQGNQDLNGDGDKDDVVAQVYTLGADRPVNLARDASGGIMAGGGKIAFSTSEADQGNKDLNGDKDAEDFVLQVYDPGRNSVFNTRYAVDGDMHVGAGRLAWNVLESDQGNKDLNRDGDTDDSVLFIIDLATDAIAFTSTASVDRAVVTNEAVGFAVPESAQGNHDLNGNGNMDDDVVHVARFKASAAQ